MLDWLSCQICCPLEIKSISSSRSSSSRSSSSSNIAYHHRIHADQVRITVKLEISNYLGKLRAPSQS